MRLTPNWLVIASIAGGLVIAIIGCTDVLQPRPGLQPRPRFVQGPLPHGITYSVGAQSTNVASLYGAMPYAAIGVSVVPGAIARIRASGDLTLTENPVCQGVFWGDLRSPISPAGGIQNWGRVDVNFDNSLDWGTQWGTSSVSQFVIHLQNSDTVAHSLMTQREGIQGECNIPGSNPAASTFDFYISGATTLSVDVLGTNVAASATNARPGDSVSFAATAINFNPAAEISWTFDTLAFYPQIDVVSCNNQLACTYAPPKTGRMQACLHDEDGSAICSESPQVTVSRWINGAPPCRAKVADYTRISLKYDSVDQYHSEPHMGQDYATSRGTPVYSADSGTVIYARWAGAAGYTVAVRSAKPDPRGLILDTYYYHLDSGSVVVNYHQPVSAGQQLARSDNSGKFSDGKPSSHGEHVHIEQHTPTPGKEAFPIKDAKGHYHNDRKTAVVPCTF